MTTLPEAFFTNVAATGVDFVALCDDDNNIDAEERMMTTVAEVTGRLLLLVTVVARRPVFLDAPGLITDFMAWLLLSVRASSTLGLAALITDFMAVVLLTVRVNCILELAALLVLIMTILPDAVVGPANDAVADLVTTTVGDLSSNTEVFPNTVGFLPTTVEGLPTTSGDLRVPLSLVGATFSILIVGNIMMRLTGGCCFVVVDTTVVGRFRGRPRPRDGSTCDVSPDDVKVVFSADSPSLNYSMSTYDVRQ